MGHFLALLARLLQLRRSLRLQFQRLYGFWTFSVGLVSLGWFVHSRNDSAIPMVLGVGVLRARSFLRFYLPDSSFFDTCFDSALSSSKTL